MNDEKQKYCQMHKYNPKFCALYNKNVKIMDSQNFILKYFVTIENH